MHDRLPQHAARPQIVVVVPSTGALRDFASGMITELEKTCDVKILGAAKVSPRNTDPPVTISDYTPSRWRHILYNTAKGLIHFAERRAWVVNAEYALYRAFAGVSPKQRRLVRWISRLGLAGVGGWIARQLLRATTPTLLPRHWSIDGILLVTSVESFFCDDIVRDAGQRRIPLLAYQGNWDNVTMKTFQETPPYLAVWGEQSFLIARFIHRIPPHRLFVTGTPRFDMYGDLPSREAARAFLKLPLDRPIILFCGTSIPFDEASPLHAIGEAIRCGDLPTDLLVLYRPHPERLPRANEPEFMSVPGCVEHAVIEVDNLPRNRLFPALLSACDALISPFSTMAIEGARAGKPVLCLAYNHANHRNFDWERQAFEMHNYVFWHADWCINCVDFDQLLDRTKDLLRLIGSEEIANEARVSSGMVFRQGSRGAASRIAEAMHSVLDGNDSDLSFRLASASQLRAETTAQAIVRDKDG